MCYRAIHQERSAIADSAIDRLYKSVKCVQHIDCIEWSRDGLFNIYDSIMLHGVVLTDVSNGEVFVDNCHSALL